MLAVQRAYYPASYDPLVLTHARGLLASDPLGACAYLEADLRNPAHILREAAATLDFTQPTAILLAAVLHLCAMRRPAVFPV